MPPKRADTSKKADADSKALPAKEQGLFKTLLSQYESKQHKKAIKTADQILAKFPAHGETVAMKGLVLTYMGKKEDGWEYAKRGVRLDFSSHICWHVFGLLHKMEKNFEEAMKAYNHALKHDKDNMNILRDAAQLQAQLGNYDGLVETRIHILTLRPSLRTNWVALIVAYHLSGNMTAARKLFEEYLLIVKEVPPHDTEWSEFLLYYIAFLEETGDYNEALSILQKYSDSKAIIDRVHAATIRARLYAKLGKAEESKSAYQALIRFNPDCFESYKQYLSNEGVDLANLTEESSATATKLLEELSTEYPKALVPQRLLLTITTGETFSALVRKYISSGLRRNIPSLFVDLKPLYTLVEKRDIIGSIVEGYREALESGKGLDTDEPEPPTTYIWTLYFLALHHSAIGAHEEAYKLLETSLSHTPTLPELYMAKARNLKRAGDYIGAAEAMEEARSLDGQDRFLNTKAATYRMRVGDIEEAQKLLKLFTKKDAPSAAYDLEEMQSLKFLLEDGEAYWTNDKLPMALKRFRSVTRIFEEIYDDQFDFHAYCIRRFTLNVYYQGIEWERNLRWHPAYIRATLNATKIYVQMADHPDIVETQTAIQPMTEEQKKAEKKARKKAAKARAEEPKKDKNEELVGLREDDDPDGHIAFKEGKPLEQAAKILEYITLKEHDNVDIWAASYDVAIRRKKYLQALRALNQLRRIDAEHPYTHQRAIDFHIAISDLEKASISESEHVQSIIQAGLFLERSSLDTLNSTYLQSHGNSAQGRLAVAKTTLKLGGALEQAEDVLFGALQPEVSFSPKEALEYIAFLEYQKSNRVDEFKTACQTRFPLSTTFLSKEEQVALQEKLKTARLAPPADDKDEVVG